MTDPKTISTVLDVAGGAVVPGFDARFIAELGRDAAGAEILSIDTTALGDAGLPAAVPVVWDRRNAALHQLKTVVEAWRVTPRAKTGTARALTLASFVELVERHATADTVIFADTAWRAPKLLAVIDYHPTDPDDRPAWGRHRVGYDYPIGEDWAAWCAQNGVAMDQGAFAAWIEDHIRSLASPTEAEAIALEAEFRTRIATPARLVDLARGLQVAVEARVEDVRTLQSGAAQIRFEETHRDADGKPLEVPGLFLLQIAPFFAGEPIRLPVRLRYRVAGGKILWFYQIVRPDLYVTERLRDDLGAVRRDLGLPVYEGTPEMDGR